MKSKTTRKKGTDKEYYDKRGVLGEMTDEDVALSLDEALRKDILSGKRKRKLRNVSIKLDPLAKITSLKNKAGRALTSRKGLRESLRAKGAPLSDLVIAARKKEAY